MSPSFPKTTALAPSATCTHGVRGHAFAADDDRVLEADGPGPTVIPQPGLGLRTRTLSSGAAPEQQTARGL